MRECKTRTANEQFDITMDPLHLTNLTSLLPSTSASSSSLAATAATANVHHLVSPEAITQTLITRYRSDLTSTWIGDAVLVVLNPLQAQSHTSLASQAEYEERCYTVKAGGGGVTSRTETITPNVYELACRAYLMMRRTGETQSIVYRYALRID